MTPPRASQHLKHVEEQVPQPQAESAHALPITNVGELAAVLAHELKQPHQLRLDLQARPLPIYADGAQSEQIIVNLMQNAIDAIREAPGDRQEIQVQVRAKDGMGPRDQPLHSRGTWGAHLRDPPRRRVSRYHRRLLAAAGAACALPSSPTPLSFGRTAEKPLTFRRAL